MKVKMIALLQLGELFIKFIDNCLVVKTLNY